MALKKSTGATAGTAKKTAAKGSTAKSAAPKKAAGPKLSEAQHKLLEKVAGHQDPAGYHADKKPENKSLESLLKHKLVKRGKKHAESGHFHYSISKAGQKHLETAGSSGASAPKSS